MIAPTIRKENERYKIIDLETPNIVLSVTYLNPQKETVGHSHPNEELYYLAQGKGRIIIGEINIEAYAGDFFCIPSGEFHKVINPTDNLLTFVCAFEGK